ncbi:MAG: purine-binding chemotaxis protein CheW [Anaerolineales bacterium]|nr:purine-binding chemotaxis protein CheW [Anaerolineales bacterium]
MEEQLVVFQLSSEQYAMSIAAVEGIIKMQSITRVPHAPACVEGVTNLRGEVLPVIDLRKRFELEMTAASEDTRIIVVELNGEKAGMVVDGVSEVIKIPEEAIEPPAAIVSGVDTAFIRGIATIEDRLIILVDLEKVLSLEEQVEIKALQV